MEFKIMNKHLNFISIMSESYFWSYFGSSFNLRMLMTHKIISFISMAHPCPLGYTIFKDLISLIIFWFFESYDCAHVRMRKSLRILEYESDIAGL